MSKKLFLAAVALCAYFATASAQEVVMDVDSLLSRIAIANADVQAARSNYDAMRQGISVAKSARLPEVTAALDLNYLGDGTILDRDFTNAMRDKLPHFANSLQVNLYQPLYQGGAISAGIELSKLQAELSAIGVDQQLDASSIEALSTFFNLQKMLNLRQVYVDNIAITEKLIEYMTAQHQQGTAIKNDITRYELKLSTLNYDLQCINNSISVFNNNLTSLLDLDPSTVIIPRSSDDCLPLLKTEDYWQSITNKESNDLKAIDKSRLLTETSLKLDKASRLPSVGLVIGDNLSGPVTFEIPALNKNYNAWYAGVSIRYTLSSLWKANKKEKQKRLELMHIDDQKEAVANALSRRVHQAYVDMQQASQMLDTELINVRLANENYTVVETRFQNDMALLTDMLDASTSKLDSEVRLVNAKINLILSYYQLKFISGTLNARH